MFDEIYTKTRDWGGRQLNYAGNSLCWLGSVVTTNPEELCERSQKRYEKLDKHFRNMRSGELDSNAVDAEAHSLSVLARSGVNVCDFSGRTEHIGCDDDADEKMLKNTFMRFFIDAGVNADVVKVAFESLACLALPIATFVAEKFESDVAQGSVFLGGCECVQPSLELPSDNGVIKSFKSAAPVISVVAKDYLIVDVQVNFHKVIRLVSLDKGSKGEGVVTEQPLIAARHRFFVSKNGISTDACVIEQQLHKLNLGLPSINLTP